jgi:hypothetical protein
MSRPLRVADEDELRRIVREEVRAALTDMLSTSTLLLTYKQAAQWTNQRRPFGDARKPVTARDVRQWVEFGFVPAVRVGAQEPRIAASELEWNHRWLRHTRDENDRDWAASRQADGEHAQAKRRRHTTPSAAPHPKSDAPKKQACQGEP